MDALRKERLHTVWTSYAIIWLGFWLLFAQYAFDYAGTSVAISDTICGALFLITGLLSISSKQVLAPWISGVGAIWLQLAPLLFTSPNPTPYLNDTLVGFLVFILALVIPTTPGRLPDTGPTIPPGWNYNPSSWSQRLPILFLGTIGWFISRYLAARQMCFIESAWDPLFGDGTLRVITSSISRNFPISDAGLGAFAYTLEVLFTLKGSEHRWRTMPWFVLLFGLLVIPLGLVSITLIILQPLVVGAWCFLCLTAALCMTLMVALSIDEVAATLQFLRHESHGRRFWRTFWKGGACPHAEIDHHHHPLDSSPLVLLKAAFWGFTPTWKLLISTWVGVYLMLTPWLWGTEGKAPCVMGAFAIVASVIAMAEIARGWRYLNVLFGAGLIVWMVFDTPPGGPLLTQLGSATILITLAFSFGKGKK